MGGLVLRTWGTEGGMTAYIAVFFLGGMACGLAALPYFASPPSGRTRGAGAGYPRDSRLGGAAGAGVTALDVRPSK